MNNVGYTPGTGATIAADEIEGVLHQRVKLGIGEEGIAEDLSKSNPMPVQALDIEFLLGTIQKLLGVCKSLQMVDRDGRQKVTLDSISANLTLQAINTISTVSTVNTVANITAIAGMNNEMYKNPARQTYAQGIRANLKFE